MKDIVDGPAAAAADTVSRIPLGFVNSAEQGRTAAAASGARGVAVDAVSATAGIAN